MAAVATALAVGIVGGVVVPAEMVSAVWYGAIAAFAAQLVLYLVFFVLAFESQPMVAHALGTVGRFLVIGVLALIWVPWVGLPAAPLLFSAVAVFFVTTLLEPLFMFRHTPAR